MQHWYEECAAVEVLVDVCGAWQEGVAVKSAASRGPPVDSLEVRAPVGLRLRVVHLVPGTANLLEYHSK